MKMLKISMLLAGTAVGSFSGTVAMHVVKCKQFLLIPDSKSKHLATITESEDESMTYLGIISPNRKHQVHIIAHNTGIYLSVREGDKQKALISMERILEAPVAPLNNP